MLSYIFCAVLALSPALQAVFDLKLQLAFQGAVGLGCLSWLLLRALGEGLPSGLAGRRYYPLWAAAGLSLLSLSLSPFRGQALPEWGNLGAGLLIFCFAPFLTLPERERVEKSASAGAWLVFVISLLDVFVLKERGVMPLTNLNALALYSVMMVPLALKRRDWWLVGALTVMIIWSNSIGAVLAVLGAAGFYAASRARSGQLKGTSWIFAVLAVLAVASLYMLQSDSVAGRIIWWRSAWRMFAARPLAGFGYASFTWAQGLFQPAGAFRERSIYAHNYYLEFLAENGLPAALAWFLAIFAAVRAKSGLLRYSLIAALLHSLVDFGLSVPANFWLFCYLLSSPEQGGAAVRPSRRASAFALALAALLVAAAAFADLGCLSFERSRRRARECMLEGRPELAAAELRPALQDGLFRGAALELLGRLNYSSGDKFRSAVYYEMALLENRYDSEAWRVLGEIYSAPGLQQQAAGLERRRREAF